MTRVTPAVHVAAAFLLFGGCEGQFDALSGVSPPGMESSRSPEGTSGRLVATPRFHRLTHTQWENTVRDLFTLREAPNLAIDFRADEVAEAGEFSTTERRLRMSDALLRDYERAAAELADRATEELVRRWFFSSQLDEASKAAFIREFGLRAFRRPLSEEEEARYLELFDGGARFFPSLESHAAGVRIVVEGLLQSPHFLYRVDLSEGSNEDGAIQLDPYVLASKLSY
ncbi:MAG: DUF1595 domain-containing protein, partial [Myxococcota bacterium]